MIQKSRWKRNHHWRVWISNGGRLLSNGYVRYGSWGQVPHYRPQARASHSTWVFFPGYLKCNRVITFLLSWQPNLNRRRSKDEEAALILILLLLLRQRQQNATKFISLITQRHSTAAKKWVLVIVVKWAIITGMDPTDTAGSLPTTPTMLVATDLLSSKWNYRFSNYWTVFCLNKRCPEPNISVLCCTHFAHLPFQIGKSDLLVSRSNTLDPRQCMINLFQ